MTSLYPSEGGTINIYIIIKLLYLGPDSYREGEVVYLLELPKLRIVNIKFDLIFKLAYWHIFKLALPIAIGIKLSIIFLFRLLILFLIMINTATSAVKTFFKIHFGLMVNRKKLK